MSKTINTLLHDRAAAENERYEFRSMKITIRAARRRRGWYARLVAWLVGAGR